MSKISKSKSVSNGVGCAEPLEAAETVAPANQIEALAAAETDGKIPLVQPSGSFDSACGKEI
jgi:hypothetical protein